MLSFLPLPEARQTRLKPQHPKDVVCSKSLVVEEMVLGKLALGVSMLAAGEGLPEVAPTWQEPL